METAYLDAAATTPLSLEVRQKMMKSLDETSGNPSSLHRKGRSARQLLERARAELAQALHCRKDELIFTSGGTEADYLGITGLATSSKNRHIVSTAYEHHAVLSTLLVMERLGYEVSLVNPRADGLIHAEDVLQAVRDDTCLVSVMWVNNETGAVAPIDELGRVLRGRRIPFHVDGVQAPAFLRVDLDAVPVDAVSFSAHKLFGPVGVGALYVRAGVSFDPFYPQGTQERGRRGGTESVVLASGMATAFALQTEHFEARVAQIKALSDRFVRHASAQIDGVLWQLPEIRTPHIVSVRVVGIKADVLLMNLDLRGVFASSGSACSAGSAEPSHVMKALGMSQREAREVVRFSFSSATTDAEVDYAVDAFCEAVHQIRSGRLGNGKNGYSEDAKAE
ncbi:cysteine desulfurase family protein [Ferroacidibacillus organovorans]|uniref:cysteine desulfurase n=1 Tax=Ferroacidibacillus organovorans TaxID=1765683 RepID=A0A162T8N0_9BACL|nr:cysteine desulfurase family protein [Ferroacidibacillus organovorans]KYP80569.1 hypothetical protein AYJ22_10920 [Ferroacidibacillus organovorans]OAG93462.1 hypothetical protein AYW79_10550 [Ferroacidibacillus organovorans]OPG17069.1 hypothetical protein B2M26_03475 [Ferroacidibacillus organovorans]